ncbi:MAG: NlpD4 [Ilumatobacteraceae bacterium]|nr:NlpD4 [Ilumatobacteraceae bacterium]
MAVLALCSALGFSALVVPTASAQDGESSALKSEYEAFTVQEQQMLQELSDAQAASQEASLKLDALNRDTQAKQIELLDATQRLTEAEHEVEVRVAERKRAEKKVKVARERLRKQIVASYVTGGEPGQMEAFLNAQSGEQIGQALAYGRAISGSTETLLGDLKAAEKARTKAAKAAKAAKDDAVETRDETQDAAKFLIDARSMQTSLLADLNVQYVKEAAALRQIQGQKAVIEGRINSMNRASDGIQQILAELQKDQEDWFPGAVETSNPLPGVKPGSAFGMRVHPILGVARLHAGDDMGAPTGTEIHAAADGIVVLAEVRGGYGNAVVIDHGHSLGTMYGHTSKLLVKPGQIVKRGDVIALVGSTGLSTGPHLHFETRIKGLPIDPVGVVDFDAPVDFGDDAEGD